VDPIAMNATPDDWSPSPEILAAYFDGELAVHPELRGRIADWLRTHPEARAVLEDYRRLAQLWQDTTPPDPTAVAWQELDARLAALQLARAPRPVLRRLAAAVVLAAAMALAVWTGWPPPAAPPVQKTPIAESDEVLAVATAAEVTILRVEGEDTQTVAVGEMPVHGPLELAGPGEVTLTNVRPDARDRMMPHVRMDGDHRPMIWARVDAEATEP
jgi:hypothetical protein